MAKRPNMGIGVIGQNDIIIKRKFRYTFEITGFCDGNQSVPEHFVTIASRPKFGIEETEINFLNSKTWLPGRATWETMTVTYNDVAHEQMQPLWNWLVTLYDFTGTGGAIPTYYQSEKLGWNAVGLLTMYDGIGNPLETWELKNMFPTDVDFGDVDYSSNDFATIALTLRYSDVVYKPLCPAYAITPCHRGCE